MKVHGVGTFGKDPELVTLPSETVKCQFSLASDRKFRDKNGDKVTEWVNCVAWGKTATTIAEHFRKGSRILIEGELQSRKFTNKENVEVKYTEVCISEFEFVDKKSEQPEVTSKDLKDIDQNFNPDAEDPEAPPFDL